MKHQRLCQFGEGVGVGYKDRSATEMQIMAVIFSNGEERDVPSYMLEYLIREKKIVAFLRSDGWVQIGRDPIRKSQLPLIRPGDRWSDFMFKRDNHRES